MRNWSSHRGAYPTALKRFYEAVYAVPARPQDKYSIIIRGRFWVRLKEIYDVHSSAPLERAKKLSVLHARLHDPYYW